MSGTVSSALVRQVLAGAQRHGADLSVLVHEAGLAGWALDDDKQRFPAVQLARLWQVTAANVDDERIGLRVAACWRLGDCQLADYIADTAATLSEALSSFLDYAPLLYQVGINNAAFTDSGAGGTFRYQVRHPDPSVSTIATEFALGSVLQRARHATGQPVVPSRVEFAAAAPRSHGELTELFGTSRIEFGAQSSAMTFGRTELDLPLRRADPVLARMLRQIADAQLEVPERVPRWIDRFRAVLAECLDDQDIWLGAAAMRLHVSPRTLQRLLEREGTTWRSELDQARREQAARLRQAGRTASEAASRLGYADARSLRRAARRWRRS